MSSEAIEMFGSAAGPLAGHGPTRRVPLAVEAPGGTVPAIVWLPEAALNGPPWPLVLVGHGAGGHKAAPIVAGTAAWLAGYGVATLSIDCPYHGDRTPPDEVGLSGDERRARLGTGVWRERNQRAVGQGVQDWRAALDAAQALPEIAGGPAGYLGLSLGCRYGLPLVAAEDRIGAAVLGLFEATDPAGPVADAARGVKVPVLFLVQWDDELFPRDGGLALFDLLGSRRKTLHASPGKHLEVPAAELGEAAAFLARELPG